MGLFVYNGSSWSSQASNFRLYNGSSWTSVARGYVYDGSQWRQFWPEAPANTSAPVITMSSGSSYPAGVDQTLSTSTGTWTNSPTSYSYQWYAKGPFSNWSAISGATSSSFGLGAAYAGAQIKVAVTATNNRGSTSVDASAVPGGSYFSSGPVTGLTASKTGYGTVSASWNTAVGADYYFIQYSMGAGYVNTSTSGTSWSISNISPGPTFSLYVSGMTTKWGWDPGIQGAGQQVFVGGLP